jgi:undecaprenyl-diphosphatase
MDFDLYRSINGFAAHHDRIEDFFRFIAVDGQYFFIAMLGILFLARGEWASRNARRGVIAAGASAALALSIAQVISHIWERPRPFVAHPAAANLFIPPSVDPSFPSDHATAAFAIAVAIFLRSRRAGFVALAMATLLSFSRVAVGTHYPGDVIAGAALGTACALFLYLPAIRGILHRLADRIAALYETVATRTLGVLRV